ncbi:MAG TPA: riboflavin synthase [Lentisphaeria bacterium]|nr:MAG: riboflavin synthase subunit alpha [Lentisphaerae bacterium GWF2_50_93]HCE43759.1 riboflavin synthase [Lentisphaeria bacterium]
MFTGIVQTVAKIADRKLAGKAGKLVIELDSPLRNPVRGESIAVNGACLTLEESSGNSIVFHVLEETLKKTNLGSLPKKSKVNIERALSVGDSLGGHMVSGHIDTTCPVKSLRKKGGDWVLSIEFPEELAPYFVEKGSVAIDGVSLTVVEAGKDYFSVHLIPTTMGMTSLPERKPGDLVNIETDIIGKYILRYLKASGGSKKNSKLDMDSLRESGWQL